MTLVSGPAANAHGVTVLRSGWRWAGLLAGVLALWFAWSRDSAPYITNDGYQYLGAASNLASGSCFCTRLAMNDEQVAFGHFPIPFTHFAPGYPLLIAAISRTGIPAATAGYLLSAFGFLLALWLIQGIALGLGARPWIAAAFSLMWITHATALFYASTVGTESLFTASLLVIVALILRDVHLRGTSFALLTGIGVVAGLSYWIRYAGLFLIGGACVYLVARGWRTPRARRGVLAGLLAAAALAVSLQIRNSVYTGSWRGAFNSGGGQTLHTVTIQTSLAFFHLVAGDRVPARLDTWMAIFLLSSALALFFGIRLLFRTHFRMDGSSEPLGWTLFIGFTYVAGVVLAALTTIADDLPRYYFAVYPLIPALAAVACSGIARGMKSLVVVVLVLSVVAVQARNLFVNPPQPDWVITKTMLAEEVRPGTPLLQWLRDHSSSEGSILAVEGQAVYYVLQRPVVAVVPADKTSRPTDEQGFRSLMTQFRSRYLLLFPGAPAERIPEQNSYDFLRSVASGNTPAWLKLAARTRDAAVYECAACAN
jgi:hypothetical protein